MHGYSVISKHANVLIMVPSCDKFLQNLVHSLVLRLRMNMLTFITVGHFDSNLQAIEIWLAVGGHVF